MGFYFLCITQKCPSKQEGCDVEFFRVQGKIRHVCHEMERNPTFFHLRGNTFQPGSALKETAVVPVHNESFQVRGNLEFHGFLVNFDQRSTRLES